METFTVKSSKQNEIVDITKNVKEILSKSKVKEGTCMLYTPHATCALTVNENYDPNVCDDILKALQKLVPEGIWKHDRVDNNAAAHIKSAILGPSESLPIREGKLQLGTWQSIMLCDFDGPRERKVYVNFVSC